MLRMKYGEAASLEFTEQVSREMAMQGWRTGLALAEEKGAAPIMDEEFVVTEAMLSKRPEMVADGIKAGDKVAGKVLWAKYSRYMQQVAGEDGALLTTALSRLPVLSRCRWPIMLPTVSSRASRTTISAM